MIWMINNLSFDQEQHLDISTSTVLSVPLNPQLPTPESKQSSTPAKDPKSNKRKLIAQPDFKGIREAITSIAESPITFLVIFIGINIFYCH